MREPLNFQSDVDAHKQKRLFRARLYFGYGVVLLLFGFLIGRMAYLQWYNFEQYHGLSEGNRISVETIPPTRGKIYDRNHILLADNQPVYTLNLIREKIEDIRALELTLMKLLDTVSPNRIAKYFKKFRHFNRSKSYSLPFSLTEKQAAEFAVIGHRFPGVTLDARLKRVYPYDKTAVHALGYVGRINSKELKKLDKSKYRGTNILGKAGIERFYEDRLHGIPGIQQIETNARGRILRKLETTPSVAGEDVHLTLDINLQKFGESLFEGKKGGLVALDPQNGEVLAFVSMPTFDPNLFVDGIDQTNYDRLLNNPDKPFINRVINGQYPPGSTIKPFVALGAIENEYISPSKKIFDPGYFDYADHRYRDWKRTGHGWVDMNDAIAQSCDTYFYALSLDMGVDAIHDSMSPFGLGAKTHIDMHGESKGILPSQAWKLATKGRPWYRGETIITSIGQGYNLTTPLQLAKATAILANRGKIIQPHLLRDPNKPSANEQVPIKKIANWDKVILSMENVMHAPNGTARHLGKDLDFRMAGKTGTAQVFNLKQGQYNADEIDKRLHDHSLFVGFAPADNPKIAVAVIVENGGSGSRTAAPMAVKLIKKYLKETELTSTEPTS